MSSALLHETGATREGAAPAAVTRSLPPKAKMLLALEQDADSTDTVH